MAQVIAQNGPRSAISSLTLYELRLRNQVFSRNTCGPVPISLAQLDFLVCCSYQYVWWYLGRLLRNFNPKYTIKPSRTTIVNDKPHAIDVALQGGTTGHGLGVEITGSAVLWCSSVVAFGVAAVVETLVGIGEFVVAESIVDCSLVATISVVLLSDDVVLVIGSGSSL